MVQHKPPQRWLFSVGLTLAQRQDDQRWLFSVGSTMAQRQDDQRWLFSVGLITSYKHAKSGRCCLEIGMPSDADLGNPTLNHDRPDIGHWSARRCLHAIESQCWYDVVYLKSARLLIRCIGPTFVIGWFAGV